MLGSLLLTLCAPFLALFFPVSIKGIANISCVLHSIIIAIVWAIDYKKFHPQESIEPVEVTEESINRYLEKSNPKHMFMAICIIPIFIIFFSIVSVVGMKAAENKISNNLNKISEEIDKMSNSSNTKPIANFDNGDALIQKQCSRWRRLVRCRSD